jgi:hypothetical protein
MGSTFSCVASSRISAMFAWFIIIRVLLRSLASSPAPCPPSRATWAENDLKSGSQA